MRGNWPIWIWWPDMTSLWYLSWDINDEKELVVQRSKWKNIGKRERERETQKSWNRANFMCLRNRKSPEWMEYRNEYDYRNHKTLKALINICVLFWMKWEATEWFYREDPYVLYFKVSVYLQGGKWIVVARCEYRMLANSSGEITAAWINVDKEEMEKENSGYVLEIKPINALDVSFCLFLPLEQFGSYFRILSPDLTSTELWVRLGWI